MNKSEAAKRLGMKESEIQSVLDSPAGTVITTIDGATLIDVADDWPDADGKTGLMLLGKPNPDSTYAMPVYTPHAPLPDDADEVTDPGAPLPDGLVDAGTDPGAPLPDTEDLAGHTVKELQAIAEALDIEHPPRKKPELIAAIVAARGATDGS